MKRIISILACVCLLLTVITIPVSAAENSMTISFANAANRTEFDASHQVWKQNGITVTNNKASSGSDVADYINPVRFYASSEVVIEYPSMTKIVVTASSSSYAKIWESSNTDNNATVTVSGSTATIVFSTSVNSYTVKSLTAQTRVKSITVYTGTNTGGGTTPIVPEIPSDPMEIVDAAFELETGESLPYTATLEGEITEIDEKYSSQYNNISVYILVEGTEYYYEMLCYRLKAGVGEDASTLKVGDIIEVTGNIKNYNGIIEFAEGSTYTMIYQAPDYSDEDGEGTAESPYFVELVKNEDDPTIYEAEAYLDFYEGDEPFFIKTVAPKSGVIGVNFYATDYYGNNVGYTYNIQNKTSLAPIQSVTKAADDEVYNHYELVYVEAGDEIVIGASTYDSKNPSVAPEAELGLYMCFYPLGSIECPEILEQTGKYTATVQEASQGYYYKWTASTDGSVTVKMDNSTGWMYSVSKAPTNIDEYPEYYYSDIHSFDDENVVMSETIEVLAGETISIFVNTFNPNDEWVAPAGSVKWTLEFEENLNVSNTAGDIDGDGAINTRDCAKLMQYINGWNNVAISEENTDLNADGKIDTRDYVLLVRYLNGWDVEFK